MRLLDGALAALDESGVDRSDVTVAWAPGAFEVPLVARSFAKAGKVDFVLCFGAVVRGDTGHYDFRGRSVCRWDSTGAAHDRGTSHLRGPHHRLAGSGP